MSMIGNHSTLGTKYNYTITAVGGGPNDRDALVARFLAGDYPDLMVVTQDWYAEFASFGIFHDFASEISAWSGDRADWVSDIPDGWWAILDRDNGDGSGDGIFALPFFSQTIIPYINLKNFTTAGLTAANVTTLEGMLAAAEALDGAGITPFAMVGKLQSDIAYMNYMFGSTNNYITANSDPASVLGDGLNGVNGTLSVEGFAAYMKLKGEGWVQSTVDTDGGGEVNTIFGAGDAAMVLVGPWGGGIFSGAGLPAEDFMAVPMWSNSDGSRSTVFGGGMTLVPSSALASDATMNTDAIELAQWLLDDENQLKTVSNWLNVTWRAPAMKSVLDDPWFTSSDLAANLVVHAESQDYAFPWGKQHPEWINIHENVMMPGYTDALAAITYNSPLTDAQYTAASQSALDDMAFAIQIFILPDITPSTVTSTDTLVDTSTVTGFVTDTVTASPGFDLYIAALAILAIGIIPILKRRRR